MKSLLKKLRVDAITYQAGLIPLYDRKNEIYRSQKNKHFFLLGDAAAQVKATTGGGLVPQQRCAEHLAGCIKKQRYRDYSNSLLHSHNRELWVHRIIRNALDTFSEQDYRDLIEIMSTRSIRNILATTDRDHAILLGLRMVIAQPRILRFLLRLRRTSSRP